MCWEVVVVQSIERHIERFQKAVPKVVVKVHGKILQT
jgi:hypothetical protein